VGRRVFRVALLFLAFSREEGSPFSIRSTPSLLLPLFFWRTFFFEAGRHFWIDVQGWSFGHFYISFFSLYSPLERLVSFCEGADALPLPELKLFPFPWRIVLVPFFPRALRRRMDFCLLHTSLLDSPLIFNKKLGFSRGNFSPLERKIEDRPAFLYYNVAFGFLFPLW